MEFGLSDEQVWQAAREVAARTLAETPISDCLSPVVRLRLVQDDFVGTGLLSVGEYFAGDDLTGAAA
jgi:hypothetical protein